MIDGLPQPPDLNNVIENAIEQQQAYQGRIDNQRKIIERYDGFRRWVLKEVVPAMEQWAEELRETGALKGASDVQGLANRTKLLGENPPEDWTG